VVADLPPSHPPDNAVELIARESFVEARHRGTYSQASYMEFISRSIRACVERGLTLLLVDISELADFHPTMTQRYEMGSLGSTAGVGLNRVAVFLTSEQLEDGFASLVARNRGLDVRTFTDRDEALRWLLQGDSASPGPR
jgi:hypothetical protein